MSSDSESGARRFQRIGKRTPGAGAAAARPQKKRRGNRSVESALKHALEYAGGCASSDDDDCGAPGPSAALAAEQAAAAAAALAETAAEDGAPAGQKQRGRQRKQKGAQNSELSKQEERWLAEEMAKGKKAPKRAAVSDAPAGSKKALKEQSLQRAAEAVDALERHSGKVRRRELLEVTRAHITETTPTKPGSESIQEEISPDAELRFRAIGGKGGGRGGGGRPAAGNDSDSDDEPAEEMLKAWEQDLDARRDAGSDDVRSAFTLRETPVAEIRRLSAECFLGGRKDEAGLLLFDMGRKVNLHFFLGTYRAMLVAKKKLERDSEAMASFPEADRAFLRWMAKRVRELNLIDNRELRLGKVLAKRMDAARKRNNFSLTLAENLIDGATGSGDEADGVMASAALHLDFEFPERPAEAARTKEETQAERAKLREQVNARQANLSTESNASLDIGAVKEALLAPTFSFDWEDKVVDDEDAWGGLEVEVPEEIQARKESKRGFFQEQLRRSVSFQQAKQLKAPSATQTSLGSRSRSNDSFEEALSLHRSRSAESVEDPLASNSALASRLRPPAAAADNADDDTKINDATDSTKATDLQMDTEDDASFAQAKDAQGTDDVRVPSAPIDAASEGASVHAESMDKAPQVLERQQHETTEPCEAAEPCEGAKADPAAPDAAPTEQATKMISEVAEVMPEMPRDDLAAPAVSGDNMHDHLHTSQDWLDEITPTAMWGARSIASPARAGFFNDEQQTSTEKRPAAAAQFAGEISPTLPFNADEATKRPAQPPGTISPTVPFEARAAGEISPTVPFEPRAPGEISPTVPFEARAPGEISPTVPFVAHPPLGEISPTIPFEAAPPTATPAPAAEERTPSGVEVAADVPAATVAPTTTAAVAEASAAPAAGKEAEDLRLAGAISAWDSAEAADASDAEAADAARVEEGSVAEATAAERRRALQDQEWLRHKRQVELQQSLAREREERKAKLQQKAASRAREMGTATMSKDELARFKAVVSSQSTLKSSGKAATSTDVVNEEDPLLAGVQRRGSNLNRSRRSIFSAATAAAATTTAAS